MWVRITHQEGYESVKVKAAAGDVIEVNERLAGKLIASNWAVPAPEPAPVVETAAVAPPENAARHTGKREKKTVRGGEGR